MRAQMILPSGAVDNGLKRVNGKFEFVKREKKASRWMS